MTQINQSESSEPAGLENRPSAREGPADPEVEKEPAPALRFPEIRLADVHSKTQYAELIELLMENGFDLEFDLTDEGRLRLGVERREEMTDSRRPGVRSDPYSRTTELDPVTLVTVPLVSSNEADAATELIPSLRCLDAGLFSYTAGLFLAAGFMALSLGPGWLGFLAGFVPASALSSWAVSGHD